MRGAQAPAVQALALASCILSAVAFALAICALSLPYYNQPAYLNGDGATLLFGMASMSCGLATGAGQCPTPAVVRYDAVTGDVCTGWLDTDFDPAPQAAAACAAFQAAASAAATLGAAGIAMYVLGLACLAVTALGGGLAAGRGRSGTTPAACGMPGAALSSLYARVPAAWAAWFFLGAGNGLGANAASLVITSFYNEFAINSILSLGIAGAGLGLGAFACLLAFVVAVLDTVACAGCCCAGRQEGVVLQAGASGGQRTVVVVSNVAVPPGNYK